MQKDLKKISGKLTRLLSKDDSDLVRKELSKIKIIIEKINFNGEDTSHHTIPVNKDSLIKQIDQVIKTYTLERMRYYIQRMIKGLNEEKTKDINDINLNRWQDYNDIITDSLWIMNKRDSTGAHTANYWGNFIPQIPNQLLKRYTKKGDWVLDAFLGSGTTLIECQRLGRNGVGIELQPKVVSLAEDLLKKERENLSGKNKTEIKLINGNSAEVDLKKTFEELKISKVQFLMMHPPYWDIIKFSSDPEDLSNADSSENFLKMFGKVLDNLLPFLENERYFAVVIGDKYIKGEWIPLGFQTMQEVLKRKCRLKSIVVKNFEETTAKRNQKELWRYRALAGGFYVFKHEYIFIFQKKGE